MTLLAQLLDSMAINNNDFARRCEMKPATFRNKLYGRLDSKFTSMELERIKVELISMKIKISNWEDLAKTSEHL